MRQQFQAINAVISETYKLSYLKRLQDLIIWSYCVSYLILTSQKIQIRNLWAAISTTPYIEKLHICFNIVGRFGISTESFLTLCYLLDKNPICISVKIHFFFRYDFVVLWPLYYFRSLFRFLLSKKVIQTNLLLFLNFNCL